MIKTSLFAALAMAAAPALAQSEAAQAPAAPPAAAQPTPEQTAVQQAASAFNQCITAGVENVAAGTAPEAGAASVVSGCVTQRQQLEQAVGAVIAALPEDQQGAARQQLQSQLDQVESQIAAALRQRDAAPSPTE